MSADVASAEAYLAQLPDGRRELIATVLDVVRRAMPPGYEEAIAFGMITWSVPLERYPSRCNKKPLQYVALASHRNYCTVYLMSLYSGSDDERTFREKWNAGGRRLDMGKSCLRFKRIDDLDPDLLADTIASTSVDDYIAIYQDARS